MSACDDPTPAEPTDWELLAQLGVPLTTMGATSRGTADDLPVHVRRAAFEVAAGAEAGNERKREALRAFLLALHGHFPTRFHEWFDGCPEVVGLLPSKPSGREIKLSRIAKERLAELL